MFEFLLFVRKADNQVIIQFTDIDYRTRIQSVDNGCQALARLGRVFQYQRQVNKIEALEVVLFPVTAEEAAVVTRLAAEVTVFPLLLEPP